MGTTRIFELIEEINRIKDELKKAEQKDLLFIHPECKKNDFYPLYTPKQLLEEINKGNWHHVEWGMVSRKEIKSIIINRIQELQNILFNI